ncbi:MAG: filamentous hemagglutinin N-terminal domain-containing protein [Candidatus Symbiobacter sp.]|nr:filamentous hemagglutinin N-terminal domain-containing protein [Candidatus Symbiobacter sp.]
MRKNKFYRKLLLSSGVALGVAGWPSQPVSAAPTGGVVTQGVGNISTEGATTNITQTTPRAVINWQKFEVAGHESVRFMVPENGATLNEITAGATHILGQVTSNGTLYFVNQNGFVFGPNSSVTAKNLVVASQSFDNAKFMATPEGEAQQINPPQFPTAIIALQGKINVADHGVVAIYGPHITTSQSASITANYGAVTLAAGQVKKINLTQGGLTGFAFDDAKFPTTLRQDGVIRAAGGYVAVVATGAAGLFNAQIDHNGTLDTSPPEGQEHNQGQGGGTITVIATHGAAHIQNGWVNTGANGTFMYHQDQPKADIVVDDNFLKRINFASGMNLDLSAGYGVIIAAKIWGGDATRLVLRAGQGILVNDTIEVGSLNATSYFFRANHLVTVGAGGLSVTTSGENWSKNGASSAGIVFSIDQERYKFGLKTQNGGNIKLTANNGGRVLLNNDVLAHDVTITGGGIGLYGVVDVKGDITLHAVNKGNIWVNDIIGGNNISAIADHGMIDFRGKVTAMNRDGLSGNVYAEVKAGRGAIIFADEVFLTNMQAVNDFGAILFAKQIQSYDRSHLPNKIQATSKGLVKFFAAAKVREDGLFDVNAGFFQYTTVNADNANIRVVISDWNNSRTVNIDAWDSYYVYNGSKTCMSHHACTKFNYASIPSQFVTFFMGGPLKIVALDIDDRLSFDHAQSAYFKAPAGIDIYTHITAKNFTLSSLHNRFMYNSTLEPMAGGTISLTEYDEFHLTNQLLDRFVNSTTEGISKVNLVIASYSDLFIDTGIHAGKGKNVTLEGRRIAINADLNSDGGKIFLVYNRQVAKNDYLYSNYHVLDTRPVTAILDDQSYRHLKPFAATDIDITSYGNLTVTGESKYFDSANVTVYNHGVLRFDGAFIGKNHLNVGDEFHGH